MILRGRNPPAPAPTAGLCQQKITKPADAAAAIQKRGWCRGTRGHCLDPGCGGVRGRCPAFPTRITSLFTSMHDSILILPAHRRPSARAPGPALPAARPSGKTRVRQAPPPWCRPSWRRGSREGERQEERASAAVGVTEIVEEKEEREGAGGRTGERGRSGGRRVLLWNAWGGVGIVCRRGQLPPRPAWPSASAQAAECRVCRTWVKCGMTIQAPAHSRGARQLARCACHPRSRSIHTPTFTRNASTLVLSKLQQPQRPPPGAHTPIHSQQHIPTHASAAALPSVRAGARPVTFGRPASCRQPPAQALCAQPAAGEEAEEKQKWWWWDLGGSWRLLPQSDPATGSRRPCGGHALPILHS